MGFQIINSTNISRPIKALAVLLMLGLFVFTALVIRANGGVWCVLGMRSSDDQAALAYFNKAIASDADNAKAYGWRGSRYLQMGLYDEALADFDQALRLDSEQVLSQVNRARTYQALYRYDEAQQEYSALIQQNPSDNQVYLLRALCSISQGNYAQAVQDCEAVLAQDPRNVEALMAKAKAEGLARQYELALVDATNAVEITPQVVYPYLTRTYISLQMGQWDNALADAKKAYEMEVQPEVYLPLTLIYMMKNDLNIAWECADKAVALGTPSAHSLKAGLYLLQKDPGQALAESDQALAADKVLGRDYLLRSEILLELGRFSEALQACEQGRQIAPNKAVVAWQEGRIHAQMGLVNLAENEFSLARQADPVLTEQSMSLPQVLNQLLVLW